MNRIDFSQVDKMTVVQLRAFLTSPELAPYRGEDEKVTSKTTKPALLEYIALAEGRFHKASESVTDGIVDASDLVEVTADDLTEAVATSAHAVVDKTTKPEVMGLHYRGRAMGAKHYRLISAMQGVTKPGERKSFRDVPPMPNSERVQKYARANGTKTLTPKQFSRVLRNRTEADGLRIWPAGKGTPEGHSLVGRTPNGLSIIYRFAN